MCGIAGIVGPGAGFGSLQLMLAAIAHRGEPAHQAEVLAQDDVAIGTNRLGIVDEAAGRQPFVSVDGAVACVMNGELYNAPELRAELAGRVSFATSCDTEVALAAYLVWGPGAAARLRGMFAVAWFDRRTEEVVLARDGLGIKPLFVATLDGGPTTVFASELKGLLVLDGLTAIEEVSPGTVVRGSDVTRYWSVPSFETGADDPDSDRQRLRATLRQTVERHLPPGDGSIACLLSGGCDSSTVTWLAHEAAPGRVEAWTLAIGEGVSEDLQAARATCDALDVPLRVVNASPQDLTQQYLARGVWMAETWEPALVRNAVAYHHLCAAVAAAGHKVCLTGEGADEVFGGYDYLRAVPPTAREDAVRTSLVDMHRTYLQMADRASMFATLEARVPYLDREVVELAATLPPSARLADGRAKGALRDLSVGVLPLGVRERPKLGMNAGAGFGSNDPNEGVYHEAVLAHYADAPDRLAADREVVATVGREFGVMDDDVEEVFDFSRFVEYGFHRREGDRTRPQLNVSRLLDQRS